MTPSEFTHPDDAAALKTLESIPVLPAVVKKVKYGLYKKVVQQLS